MVTVLASNMVDRGFEPRSGQTKDYKSGMCCFSANPATLRGKNKDWLARNQNNVSDWKANPAILQLYYGENKLIINEMMIRSTLY
jgi:hypothetical protein